MSNSTKPSSLNPAVTGINNSVDARRRLNEICNNGDISLLKQALIFKEDFTDREWHHALYEAAYTRNKDPEVLETLYKAGASSKHYDCIFSEVLNHGNAAMLAVVLKNDRQHCFKNLEKSLQDLIFKCSYKINWALPVIKEHGLTTYFHHNNFQDELLYRACLSQSPLNVTSFLETNDYPYEVVHKIYEKVQKPFQTEDLQKILNSLKLYLAQKMHEELREDRASNTVNADPPEHAELKAGKTQKRSQPMEECQTSIGSINTKKPKQRI